MAWGLALSGGGVLGAAHLGVLAALDEWGLRPDTLAGTSAGGVVAGVIAAGGGLAELTAYGRAVCADPLRYFRPRALSLLAELLPHDPLPPADSVLDSTPFVEGLAELCPGAATVADWKLPTALTSVDVCAMEAVVFLRRGGAIVAPRGRWRSIEDAPLRVALQSTMAMPGIYTMVQACDGLLVDGGVADILPVDWSVALGAERIIAVNVAPASPERPARPGILWTLAKSFGYAESSLAQLRRRQGVPVLTLAPDTSGTSGFGFGDYDRLVQAGLDEANRRRVEILAFVGASSPPGA